MKKLLAAILFTTFALSAHAAELEIKLGSNDMMQFDQTEITVPAGATIKLTLTHNGKLPKAAMGHNFVLLKQGTDVAAFAVKAMSAAATEYIPEGDSVIAHTGLIGGGESSTVTFEAPAPGIYEYICSFPGHYAIMRGKLVVE